MTNSVETCVVVGGGEGSELDRTLLAPPARVPPAPGFRFVPGYSCVVGPWPGEFSDRVS